jgi:hypothetical protein
MAVLRCACGHNTKANYYPSDVTARLLDDYDGERLVWECEGCGSLFIGQLEDANEISYKRYVPEDGISGKLFVHTTEEKT